MVTGGDNRIYNEPMIEEFMRAARQGDLETLQSHPELVNIHHDGATALHFAAIEGRIEAARWLLEHGAALDAKDDQYGATPAAWANEKGRQDMVDFLLAQGAAITPFEAAAFGKLDRLQAFVAADPSLLTREREWGTLAHTACIWGRTEILEWLIGQGIEIERRSRQGLTPLDIAENQARDARRHAPILLDRSKTEIERNCARIAARLRGALHAE